jgi:uncharacterized protein (DUF1778 family)
MSDKPLEPITEAGAVQLIQGTEKSWEQTVLEYHRCRCANCGSKDKIRPQLVVHEEAGGQRVLSNSTVLCRACEMAQDVVNRHDPSEAQRPVNFWVSRTLYDKVKSFEGFSSTSSLVRYLMRKFVDEQLMFEDLEFWQDQGSDVKINVWVDPETYDLFKKAVNNKGMTVTDALKSLLCMYGADVEPLVKKRS